VVENVFKEFRFMVLEEDVVYKGEEVVSSLYLVKNHNIRYFWHIWVAGEDVATRTVRRTTEVRW
jgi:hypothetical protein